MFRWGTQYWAKPRERFWGVRGEAPGDGLGRRGEAFGEAEPGTKFRRDVLRRPQNPASIPASELLAHPMGAGHFGTAAGARLPAAAAGYCTRADAAEVTLAATAARGRATAGSVRRAAPRLLIVPGVRLHVREELGVVLRGGDVDRAISGARAGIPFECT
jgi:hypothetical protein